MIALQTHEQTCGFCNVEDDMAYASYSKLVRDGLTQDLRKEVLKKVRVGRDIVTREGKRLWSYKEPGGMEFEG